MHHAEPEWPESLSEIPEAARGRYIWEARRRALRHPSTWLGIGIGALFICFGLLSSPAGTAMGLIIGTVVFETLWWSAAVRYLKESEWRRCRRCGYDLQGCRGPRCPECGVGIVRSPAGQGQAQEP